MTFRPPRDLAAWRRHLRGCLEALLGGGDLVGLHVGAEGGGEFGEAADHMGE
jgi:hypothetical protein